MLYKKNILIKINNIRTNSYIKFNFIIIKNYYRKLFGFNNYNYIKN